MLYIVECDFINPKTEQNWNQFYSADKLPKLISVSGFLTSQRFKKIKGNAPTYLAIHTITDSQVLNSEEYRTKGGGNFGQWQAAISHWHRNLYEYSDNFPAVGASQYLVIGLEPITDNEIMKLIAIKNIGLDQSHSQIWIAIVNTELALNFDSETVAIYEPITEQLNKQ